MIKLEINNVLRTNSVLRTKQAAGTKRVAGIQRVASIKNTSGTVRIIGMGSALPSLEIGNADFLSLNGTSDEWIRQRSGIVNRRYCGDGETSATLALEAALNAMAMAGVTADELDLIICGTVSPAQATPPNAAMVQTALGCRPIPAFDLSSACTGFMFGMHVARQWLAGGSIKTALVIGSECLSRLLDFSDRSSCFLFGDGAGAAILQSGSGTGARIVSSDIATDGRQGELIQVPSLSRSPSVLTTLGNSGNAIKIEGREVFRFAVTACLNNLQDLKCQNGFCWSEIDLILPHQVNIRILEAIADKLGVPLGRFFVNLDKYGNTGAASVPIALDEAVRLGKIKDGGKVVMFSMGGGLSWATALLHF